MASKLSGGQPKAANQVCHAIRQVFWVAGSSPTMILGLGSCLIFGAWFIHVLQVLRFIFTSEKQVTRWIGYTELPLGVKGGRCSVMVPLHCTFDTILLPKIKTKVQSM